MSTKFFFKSFSIKNFRVFKSIEFDNIKRINLISGMNGSGKTALIETMFLTLDMNNPLCLVRAFQWRGISLSGDDFKLLFPDHTNNSKIISITSQGDSYFDLSFGPPESDLVTSISHSLEPLAKNALSQLSTPNLEGISIFSRVGSPNNQPSRLFFSQVGDQINSTTQFITNQPHGSATYLSLFFPTSPTDFADRLSKIIKRGDKRTLISYFKMLNPNVEDIELFQDGPIAQAHVLRAGDKFTPLSLMGGGLRALAEIVVATMVSRDGVVFIDEVDAALHFSAVPKLWKIIAEIANAENVQIFGITHSREGLALAAAGIKSAGRSADFQYIRIDEGPEKHSCTRYSMNELQDAIELHVEVR